MSDLIEIHRLKVMSHIGVPHDERARPQPLWITVRMTPGQGFDRLADAIERTVDYQQVADQLTTMAAVRPRHLIETLATEAADLLLREHPLAEVWIRIEKQILPNADCVAVEISRCHPAG